jgi:hypothetical protein
MSRSRVGALSRGRPVGFHRTSSSEDGEEIV